MTIEEPDVPAPGDGYSRVAKRSYLILCFTCAGRGALFRFFDHEVDFGEREARELDIELEIDQGLELDREHVSVPPGVQGQLVVGEHVGSSLRLVQMG